MAIAMLSGMAKSSQKKEIKVDSNGIYLITPDRGRLLRSVTVDVKANNYEQGVRDGKQAVYDVFWDVLQGEGTRFSYYFAFCGLWNSTLHYGWNDDIYNPKYPIILGDGKNDQTVFGQQVFYYNTEITDTKVDIIVNISELKNTFVNFFKLLQIL